MKRYSFPLAMLGIVAIAAIAVLAFDIHAVAAAGFAGSVASISAPNWYTKQYDTRVRHILQNEGFLLRGTTSEPVQVTGDKLQFFVLGKGEATPMSQSVEMVKFAHLPKTTLDVTMQDWQFAEPIRHGEPERISVNYREAIAEEGSMALGRRFDRIIMEAMDAETSNIATVGDGSAAVSPIMLSTAKAAINAIGMMKMNEFFMPVPSIVWEQLKLYKIFNNADYTPRQLLFEGRTEARLWNGIWVFQAPDDMFTVPNANMIDTYIWNKKTLGFGYNYGQTTRITYENLITAWLYNMVMSGAAKVIQTPGVKRVRLKMDAALAIN